MPGDLSEPLLRGMVSASLGRHVASLAVLGVDHAVTDSDCSDMSRLRARIVTDGGGREELSLLVKRAILQDQEGGSVLQEMAELTTEIKVYREILPEMDQLMPEADRLWPHCIGTCGNTTLVLQDLKELGYGTVDRHRGLDYPEARCAVRGLARFHAASRALRRSGKFQPADFTKFIFSSGSTHIRGFISSSFQYLHAVASAEWSPEWREVRENVGKMRELAVDKISEISRLQEDSPWNVLNHGDPWVNNIMFKSGRDGAPESVRFVDFQLSHYNSCTFDLHYLMNTSLSPETLHQIDRLYSDYHSALSRELERLGLPQAGSLEDLLEELQRTEFFGLFSAVCIGPVIVAPEELSLKASKEGLSLAQLEERKKGRFRVEEYRRRIQVLLRRAQHGGLFKRIFI